MAGAQQLSGQLAAPMQVDRATALHQGPTLEGMQSEAAAASPCSFQWTLAGWLFDLQTQTERTAAAGVAM